MLRQLTYKQLLGWEAYNAVEPFGWQWENYRIASVVLAIYNGLDAVAVRVLNAFRGERQRAIETRPLTLDDCVLTVKEEEEKKKERVPQTIEEQIAVAKIWAMTAAAIHKEEQR